MMDCKQISERMVEYLYQELEASERESFDAHVQSCARCQQELAAYERTRTMMQDLSEQEPSPSITAALLQAAAQPAESEKPDFWQRLRESLRLLVLHPAMTAAVTLVVVLGVSFFIYKRSAPPTQPTALEHLQVEVDKPLPSGTSTLTEGAAEDDRQAAQPAKSEPMAAQGQQKETERVQPPSPALNSLLADREQRGAGGKIGNIVGEQSAAKDEAQSAERKVFKRRLHRRARKGALGFVPEEEKELSAPAPRQAPPKRAAAQRSIGGGAARGRKPARSSDFSQRADLDALNAPATKAPQGTGEAVKKQSPVALSSSSDKTKPIGLELLQRGDRAQTAGRCLEALSLYNQAISVEPELRAKVLSRARRCASLLAAEDEGKLLKAREANVNLAGMLGEELRRAQRARRAHTRAKAKAKQNAADKKMK